MAISMAPLDEAFASVPALRKRIYSLLEQEPQHSELFQDIGTFILSQTTNPDAMVLGNGHSDGPPSKKRRMGEDAASSGPGTVIFEARDISFSLPMRKKLHLGLLEHAPESGGGKSYSIQLRNPASNQVESTHSLQQYSHILRLPVPEKNQKQHNFCLIPAGQSDGATEPIIWTVNDGPLKSYKIENEELRAAASSADDVLEDALNYVLRGTGRKVVLPSDDEFVSAIRESHRKGDTTYHVKSFRGSKEGYLFFLENGIFFGYKKPLVFFSFDDIESVSYTSVLQRTFNLSVIAMMAGGSIQEIEFSMLDQQDFAGIDAYIKRHQLQDASLADARRAKKVGKAAKNADADTNGDQTELEKAQAEMEDEEDELEEDYDPDESGDESDSGSESGEEEYTGGKGRNLVAEELGSEAEDVSASEEEEEEAEEERKAVQVPEKIRNQPVKQKKPVQMPTHSIKSHSTTAPDLDDDDQL